MNSYADWESAINWICDFRLRVNLPESIPQITFCIPNRRTVPLHKESYLLPLGTARLNKPRVLSTLQAIWFSRSVLYRSRGDAHIYPVF